MSTKKTLEVLCEGKSYKVSWFSGSGDVAIEKAIRAALHLEADAPLWLVDDENHTIAICDSLPDGLKLTYVSDSSTGLVEPRGPTPWPIIGNTFDLVGKEGMNKALMKLTETYGSLVSLQVPGLHFFVCCDADILQDMLRRPEDFQKTIAPSNMDLGNLRAYTSGDGLFTSSDSEEMWQIAHRILLPGFSMQAIRNYYDRMLEIADDLIHHFEELPAGESVLITDWMTRMTFEAIGYAGFSTRFHCMDHPELPPFVKAMVVSLADAMQASQRVLPEPFYFVAKQKRQEADTLMKNIVDQLIRERKGQMEKGEAVPNDLMQIMLTSKDRITGRKLPEENIRNQLITFLIAGHETTSSLLSYAIYRLIANPDIEKKVIEEVDQVLGRDYSHRPSYTDLEKLEYTQRVLKETLRLDPTAPGFSKTAMKDTIVAGKYSLQKGDMVFFHLPALHRDQKYWKDPDHFDPDRFLPEEVSKRHPDAYHPFGAGVRSCIGFQFALSEATMVLARLYQRYRFHLKDKNYILRHVETLTVKPKDLYVLIEKRPEEKGKLPKTEVKASESVSLSPVQENAPPLLILYGSNMGTCQGIAHELAQHAQSKGYRPIVRELDAQVDQPWESSYVGIITSTYNGTPPDNALSFEKWLRKQSGSPFSSINYTVLGVGNKQWRTTFQQFPRLVNQRMGELGARCFYPIGAADVDGDYDQAIETWARGAWQVLQKVLPPAPTGVVEENPTALIYSCEVVNFAGGQSRKIPHTPLDEQALKMTVTHNQELYAPGAQRSARHLEIQLPQKTAYTAGDHLGVLPENPPEAVELTAKLFNLRLDDMVVVKSLQEAMQTEKLPVGLPITIRDLLTGYVDLLGPVSRKELRLLALQCPCPPEKKALEELAEEKFAEEVLSKERTFLEICQQFRSVNVSLELLLSARPALKPRYYSISSSPLEMPDSCTITVGVQEHTTPTGRLFQGLCSHYLANVPEKGFLQCFVKDTKSHFRLPQDPSQDLILIGPGTGLAPLRGFLQEREQQKKKGVPIGRQLLFFGCRHPDQDYLYRQELEEYQKTGLLQGLFVAFSRVPDTPKCYVQDLLMKHAPLVWEYVQNKARILLCGDGKHMAPSVREALLKIFTKEGKLSDEEAQKFFKEKQDSHYYVEDVWAG